MPFFKITEITGTFTPATCHFAFALVIILFTFFSLSRFLVPSLFYPYLSLPCISISLLSCCFFLYDVKEIADPLIFILTISHRSWKLILNSQISRSTDGSHSYSYITCLISSFTFWAHSSSLNRLLLHFYVPLPLVWFKNFRIILTGLWSDLKLNPISDDSTKYSMSDDTRK